MDIEGNHDLRLSGGQEELGHGGTGWSWWELWPEGLDRAYSKLRHRTEMSLGMQLKKHTGLGVGFLFGCFFKMGKAAVCLPCERKEPSGTEK